jgi:urocanate hydratase
VKRGVTPDFVTEQTARTIRSWATCRAGLSLDEAAALRKSDPAGVRRARSKEAWPRRCARCSRWSEARARSVFDYGNNIRAHAKDGGRRARVRHPGLRAAYVRQLFCEGKGPFRWVALSGDPRTSRSRTRACWRSCRTIRTSTTVARHGQGAHRVPGPARAHLLARLRRPAPRGPRVQRAREEGQGEGADRDRARSPRLRLGREPPTARPRR